MAPKFMELDRAMVGELIIRLPLMARQFGHEHVQGTLDDYYHPQTLEAEFVHDVFTNSTEEIIDKWFGGDADAVRLTSAFLTAIRS
jgi:hypothetical protein